MDEMLAEYGLDTTSAGLIAIAVCAVGWFVASGGGGAGEPGCVIELHPEQKKYMLSKEATFATSSTEGKGIRMIIDYLREEKQDAVRAILDEKPAFTTGMEKFEMDVHDQQLDFLSDDLGIKMNDSEDAVERYAPFGKVARACLDWAMRMEKEGKNKDYDLYETVRCLNC